MTNIEKLLYTIAEAQVALGISRSKLWKLIKEKLLETCKLGRRRMITARSLHEFIANLPRP